jgi:hypothetical protein
MGLAITGILFASAVPGTARAVEPLHEFDIVLLQPGEMIEQRVDGGADALAAYVKRLGIAGNDAMRANPEQIPSTGFIVVAARPGGLAHAWFDFQPALGEKATEALTQVVATVAPPTVRSGNLVFALRVGVWSTKPPAKYAPAPSEWNDAAKQAGHKLDVDAMVDQLWPR